MHNKEITDKDRLDYLSSLDDPIITIGWSKFCLCGSCRGYTVKVSGEDYRSYSEDSLRNAIDKHMNGNVEHYPD